MRDKRLDVLKGLGIIIMVYRHAYAPFSDYFLLFHMAVFFIASGYLFKSDSVGTAAGLGGYIKRKLLHLWLPYFIFTSLFILLNNFFIQVGFYTIDPAFLEQASGKYERLAQVFGAKDILINIVKGVFMRASTEIGGALWFFQTLLYVTVAYGIIEFLLLQVGKKLRFINTMVCQGIIAVVFLLMGWVCYKLGISALGIERLLSCYSLFFIGQLVRKYNSQFEKCLHGWISVVLFLVCIVITYVLRQFGTIAIDKNQIINPVFFIVASIVGWLLYYIAANFIDSRSAVVSGALQNITRKSVFIIGLHFVAFKLVNWIYVLAMHEEKYMVAKFPVSTRTGAWWMLYVLAGILLPMVVASVYEFLKKKIVRK